MFFYTNAKLKKYIIFQVLFRTHTSSNSPTNEPWADRESSLCVCSLHTEISGQIFCFPPVFKSDYTELPKSERQINVFRTFLCPSSARTHASMIKREGGEREREREREGEREREKREKEQTVFPKSTQRKIWRQTFVNWLQDKREKRRSGLIQCLCHDRLVWR